MAVLRLPSLSVLCLLASFGTGTGISTGTSTGLATGVGSGAGAAAATVTRTGHQYAYRVHVCRLRSHGMCANLVPNFSSRPEGDRARKKDGTNFGKSEKLTLSLTHVGCHCISPW